MESRRLASAVTGFALLLGAVAEAVRQGVAFYQMFYLIPKQKYGVPDAHTMAGHNGVRDLLALYRRAGLFVLSAAEVRLSGWTGRLDVGLSPLHGQGKHLRVTPCSVSWGWDVCVVALICPAALVVSITLSPS